MKDKYGKKNIMKVTFFGIFFMQSLKNSRHAQLYTSLWTKKDLLSKKNLSHTFGKLKCALQIS
jgi:hypothetical protein